MSWIRQRKKATVGDGGGQNGNTSKVKPWAGTELGAQLAGPLAPDLDESLERLREILPAADLQVTHFVCLEGQGPRAAVVFNQGIVDRDRLEDRVIRPLQYGHRGDGALPAGKETALADWAAEALLPVAGHTCVRQREEAVMGLLDGRVLLLLDGSPEGLLLNLQNWKERSLREPPSETTVRGPKVGFNESLLTNISLLRMFVRDPNLRVEILEVGVRSRTQVAVLYLEALAQPKVVDEVLRRIRRIDVDFILDIQHVAELTQPGFVGPFALHSVTERPDRLALGLYFGKVGILVNGSSTAMFVPTVLTEGLLSMDDYYVPVMVATFLRLLRFTAWMVVTFTPALYVALMAYNPAAIRVDLAVVLAGARVGVPLNVVLEVLLLEVMMELLQEATVRLPTKIGSAATVVGGLIIGQAAAQARLVSNIMVVIVAMTAVASFSFPIYEHGLAWRLMKWANVAAASVFGLFGVWASFMATLAYLNSLESYGVPLLAPFSPFNPRDLFAEAMSRLPHWARRRRPKSLLPREGDAAVTGEAVKP